MPVALPRRLAALLTVVSFAVAPLHPVLAQTVDPSGDPLPITLEAKPDGGWAGTPIALSGRTLGTEGMDTVTLTVTPPEGSAEPAPKVLAATADDEGFYLATFEETAKAGTYSVLATAPDGRGQASLVFEIFDAPDVADQAGEVLEQALDQVRAQAEVVQDKIEGLPPSPARDEAKAALADIVAKADALRREAAEANTAMATLIGYSVADPELAEATRDAREQLLEGLQGAHKQVQLSAAELERLRAQTATCDSLEVVVEGLKWASFLMNLAVGKVLDLAVNFGKELLGVVTERVAKAVGTPDMLAFGSAEVGKNIDLIVKRKAPTDTLTGLLNDILGKAAEQWMSVYCEVFTGPVSGHMSAQFYDQGTMWWSYEMSLTGRITLHYPKDAAGDSIPVKGRIEGYGHSFSLWENALSVLYPGLMASAVQRKQVIGPIDLGPDLAAEGANYAEGSVAGAGLPNSFFIAVTGQAEANRISVTLGPARVDMEPKARVIAIIMSPLSMLPVVTAYELPYKEARFVFERASGGADMVVPIAEQGKVLRGSQTFYNERGNAEAQGTYTVTLELCNPDCGGAPAGGQAKP